MKTLSIVTINYNNSEGLKKTIESVVNQTYKNYEFLIIDGGSIDNSVSVIKEYEKEIDYWVSESDSGIYNAMNKGIKKASGEYVLMLNSGDYLCSNSILAEIFLSIGNLSYDIYYCNIYWETNGNLSLHSFPGQLTFNYFREDSLGHQATFIKRTLHEKIGMYDEQLKIASDWKFFITAVCIFCISYLHIPIHVTICSRDGISCDPKNTGKILHEKEIVFKKYFSAFLPDYTVMDSQKIELSILRKNIKEKLFDVLRKIKKKIIE